MIIKQVRCPLEPECGWWDIIDLRVYIYPCIVHNAYMLSTIGFKHVDSQIRTACQILKFMCVVCVYFRLKTTKSM